MKVDVPLPSGYNIYVEVTDKEVTLTRPAYDQYDRQERVSVDRKTLDSILWHWDNGVEYKARSSNG